MSTRQNASPGPRSSGTWAFFCATGEPGPFPFLVALLVGTVLLVGCGMQRTNEVSFPAQISEVRRGDRHAIHVEQVPLVDIDLRLLTDVNGLESLMCDHPDSQFTAAGLAPLRHLPALTHLRIRGRGIDDAALAEIVNITPLRILNLPSTTVTDSGLKFLAELPNLEQLRIGSPHITLEGIKAIAALPALKRLHTIDIPITDEGLGLLAGMQHLESLYIDGGSFSDAAADELFRARPALHIHFNQEHHDRDPHRHSHP